MLLPSSKTLTLPDAHGRPINLLQPLVQNGQRPYYGWSSSISIKGSKVELRGNSPHEVAAALKNIAKLNNIEADDNRVWTTLNLAWLPRTPKRHRMVDAQKFFENVTTTSGDFSGKVPVSVWLPPVLDSLGYSLAVEADAYDFAKFRSAVEFFASMTDPTSTFRLGDHRLAVSFLECSSALSYKPAHLLNDAKIWFVKTYNEVADIAGLSKLSNDTAKLKYKW